VSDNLSEVIELTPSLHDRYERFVGSQPSALIYYSLPFRDFLCQTVGGEPRYLIAFSGDQISGVLPMFVKRDRQFGAVVNSLPWYGSHGGCLLAGDDHAQIRGHLLSRYLEVVAEEDASFATLIPSPDESQRTAQYAAQLSSLTTDVRISQMTRLPDAAADLDRRLAATCRQKTRNLVRKSLKQGFEWFDDDSDDSWQFLYDTHVENLTAIGGRAKPQSHFDAMRTMIPPDLRQLITVSHRGVRAAALLLFRFNTTVEYVTPVIKNDYRPLQPLSFAIWHAMRLAAQDGFRQWNWGGTWTTQHSLRHFKAGWGAEERTYTYFIHAAPAARAQFEADSSRVAAAFPYYYLFPYRSEAK
jgi:hypothetical protein